MTLVIASSKQRRIESPPPPECPPPLSKLRGGYGHLFPFLEFNEMFQLALANREFYGEFNRRIYEIVVNYLQKNPQGGVFQGDDRLCLISWLEENNSCGPDLPPLSRDVPVSILVNRIFHLVYHVFATLSKDDTPLVFLETSAQEFRCFGPFVTGEDGSHYVPPGVAQEKWESWEEIFQEVKDFCDHVKAYKERSVDTFLFEFSNNVLPFLHAMKSSRRGAVVQAAAKKGRIDLLRLLLATGAISEEFKEMVIRDRGYADQVVRLLNQGQDEVAEANVEGVRPNRGIDSDDD
jgi:hypothetical protein